MELLTIIWLGAAAYGVYLLVKSGGVDLFGVKINTNNKSTNNDEYISSTEYEITKEKMLQSLGFEPDTVSYIKYDAAKKKLIIRGKKQKISYY